MIDMEERFNTYNFVMRYGRDALANDSLCDLQEAEGLLVRQLALQESITVRSQLEKVRQRLRILEKRNECSK
jgi:hypothetical protein